MSVLGRDQGYTVKNNLLPDMKKTIFVNSEIWDYRFGRKKLVNYDEFEIASKQRESNI